MAESANHQRATSGNERGWCAEQGTDLEPLAKARWQESRKRSETAGLAELSDDNTGNSSTTVSDKGAATGAEASR